MSVASLSLAPRAQLDPLAALILQSDYWRREVLGKGAHDGHKEWSHFCVLGPELDLLINFNLAQARSALDVSRELARVVLLARTPGSGWCGDVETLERGELALAGGGIDARFGRSSLRFRGGAYELEVATPDGAVAAELRLVPLARPALTSSVPLARGATMKWLVVPQLAASGAVRVHGRRQILTRAPAYHDHDWGPFGWGGDFSWEWAIVLPELDAAPWTIVFQRISDRARHRVLSQGLLVWRNGVHARTLHGRDLSVQSSGLLRQRRPLRIPRPMALVAGGAATDAPRRLEVRATSGADAIELALELVDLAQIAVPNDGARAGATLVCEAHARARVAGIVRGERLRFEARALLELNRAPA